MAKKIGAIVSLSVIGVLIIATIIMANIQISYNINCATPDAIYISYSNRSYTEVTSETNANKIVEFINGSSKESSLSALFNGNFGKKATINSVSGTKSVPSNSAFYIDFSYNQPQKLMDGDKEFGDGSYTYDRLIFTVTDAEEVSVVKVFVIPDSNAPTMYSHYYELEADFSELYNYLVENNYNN